MINDLNFFMSKNNRWVLLRHIGAPNDPLGMHYDLLLEDGDSCRTWRLQDIPLIDAPPQKVVRGAPHKLIWLEQFTAKLSGGRGSVERVLKGFFVGEIPSQGSSELSLELHSNKLNCLLVITDSECSLRSLAN